MFSSFSHHYSSHSSTVSSVMKERICDSHKCTKRKNICTRWTMSLLIFVFYSEIVFSSQQAVHIYGSTSRWAAFECFLSTGIIKQDTHTHCRIFFYIYIYLYLIKRGMKSTLRCLQFALFATKGNKTLVTVIDRFDFKAFLNPLQQEFSRFSCAKSFRATKCTFLTSVSYVSTQRLGGYIYNDSSWTGLQVF